MRPGRVAVLASLPVLVALGARHSTPAQAPVALGVGMVTFAAQPVLQQARIVTDGRPILLPTVVAPAAPRPAPGASPARRVRHRVTVTAPAAVRRAAVAAPTTADRYPFANDTTGASDPWGFAKRQCVSYVAWRQAQVGRPLDNARDSWGSALTWDDTARRLGDQVSATPSVGAVAQWDGGERSAYWGPGSTSSNGWFEAGPMGHVAWVTKVYPDGSVQVSQYNGTGTRTFSTMRVRAPRFLSL
jgi:surface antigen